MSHFSVLIIDDNIEKQLAPYQENNMGDCPKEYLEFHDEEDKFAEEYKTGSTTKVKTPDGQLLWSWDERFRVPEKTGIGFGFGFDTHQIPEDCKEVKIKFTEIYSTFEEFVHDYHGMEKRDPDIGRYGYWQNPNAKWDWYEIGGRWTGFLPLKPNAIGEVGKPGIMTKPARPGYADQARLCDIDIERAQNEAEAEARKLFATWRLSFEKFGKAKSFVEIRDSICGNGKNFNSKLIEKARKQYQQQPAIEDFVKDGENFFIEPVSDLGYDEEEYVDKCRARALTTFAVVKDGQWYEKSEMGWWGVSYNEKMSQEEWNKNFVNLLNTLHPETLLTVVDCHI